MSHLQHLSLSVPPMKMEKQVTKNCPIIIISENNLYLFNAENGVDCRGFEDVPLIFGVGDNRVCHSIYVLNDSLCKLSQTEDFISFLEYEIMIIISPDPAHIIINDSSDSS